MITAVQHLEIYADKIKGVEEMSEMSPKCASCNIVVIFTYDDLLLGFKPHKPPLFMDGYIKE